MNNPTKIATIAFAGVALYTTYQVRTIRKDMTEAYPNHDPKLVMKAYRQFMLDSFTGNLKVDLMDKTSEEMADIFAIYLHAAILNK